MQIYVYIYIVCIYTYMHTLIHAYRYLYVYVHVYTYMYAPVCTVTHDSATSRWPGAGCREVPDGGVAGAPPARLFHSGLQLLAHVSKF